MKLIPNNTYFYFDNYGKTLKAKSSVLNALKKNFNIIKGNDTVANLVKKKKLVPGDVCGDGGFLHHTIIYLGKKSGAYRFLSFGSGKFSKSKHYNVGYSGSHKIGIILHPK